ncbi:hypothetical protein BAR24066_01511 [Burkholderia arboris]|uniref:Uncharacterized protein n=1 Tax=Burkholderia arboris TaxID=488730 RepID=A0A9Q9SFW2_9BURK|nr:hypothetical protein BAR24066_01511 [Burkholderia arboris]
MISQKSTGVCMRQSNDKCSSRLYVKPAVQHAHFPGFPIYHQRTPRN